MTGHHSAPRVPVRRKIAVATWRPSRDGRIYARMEVDVTPALAYIDRVREETGERITITHVVGAALGRALRAVPEVRARVVFGRLRPLERCDIGFAVDIDRGSDLAPIKVHDVDRLSPVEIAQALDAGAGKLRRGDHTSYKRTSSLVKIAPAWALRPVMAAAGVVAGGFGKGFVGQPGFPLGTAFVSNVGTLGLDEAFLAPCRWPARRSTSRWARCSSGRSSSTGRSSPGRCSCSSRRPTTGSSTGPTRGRSRRSCGSC